MTIKLVVPIRTDQDRATLKYVNDWCIQHRVNLFIGENPGYVSMLFTGNNPALSQLRQYLRTLNLQW